MDIGLQTVTGPNTHTPSMNSVEQSELAKPSPFIENNTVFHSELESSPHWLIYKAVKSEVEDAWNEAFIEISDRSVPRYADIITSHIIYKIKTDEIVIESSKPHCAPMKIEIVEKEPIGVIHQTFNWTPYVFY